MPNFTVDLRKRDLGDSFEMVLDPFMFNMEMTALADVANALVDTGATKTCIGLDVVKKLQLKPIRTEAIDTATSGNEEVMVYKLLLSLSPGHFMPIEVYGIPNPKTEAVIIGSDAVCQHHTLLERIVFPCHKIIAIQKSTSDRLFPNPFWALWNRLLPRPIPVVMISASCQDSVYSYFSNKLCREMATQINSFKYVSVRDEWTQEMFRHVTRNKINPPITPDPVFAFMPNAGDMLPSFGELRQKFDLPDKYFLFSS